MRGRRLGDRAPFTGRHGGGTDQPVRPGRPVHGGAYREAAHTRQVPRLFAHRRLVGGGDLQVMEWLRPVAEDEAVAFHRALAGRAPEVAGLVDIVCRVHERAVPELPWCGPLDHNPANVMRAPDGRLVAADLFYADGPNLYAAAATNPDLVVARIPEAQRRFMTEMPLAASGRGNPVSGRRYARGSRQPMPAIPRNSQLTLSGEPLGGRRGCLLFALSDPTR